MSQLCEFVLCQLPGLHNDAARRRHQRCTVHTFTLTSPRNSPLRWVHVQQAGDLAVCPRPYRRTDLTPRDPVREPTSISAHMSTPTGRAFASSAPSPALSENVFVLICSARRGDCHRGAPCGRRLTATGARSASNIHDRASIALARESAKPGRDHETSQTTTRGRFIAWQIMTTGIATISSAKHVHARDKLGGVFPPLGRRRGMACYCSSLQYLVAWRSVRSPCTRARAPPTLNQQRHKAGAAQVLSLVGATAVLACAVGRARWLPPMRANVVHMRI